MKAKDPRANAFLLRSDPDDYARLFRCCFAAEEMRKVGKILIERKPIESMDDDEQQSLYVAMLGMERPHDVTDMLATFAADDELPLDRYRAAATALTDDAQRMISETMTRMKPLCAQWPDLVADLDRVLELDAQAAEETHTAACLALDNARGAL